jgi:transcriptional regulator with XRE-family HTH domain
LSSVLQASRPQRRPDVITLAARIHGFSLRRLAEELGVSHSHLSRALRGERPLTDELAGRLVAALTTDLREASPR